MSDPVTATTVAPQPGWYPDPAGSSDLRWWNGARWTESLHPAAAAAAAAAVAAAPAPPAPLPTPVPAFIAQPARQPTPAAPAANRFGGTDPAPAVPAAGGLGATPANPYATSPVGAPAGYGGSTSQGMGMGLGSLPFSPRIVGAVLVAVSVLVGGAFHLRGSSVNVTIGAGPISQARDVAVQSDLRTTASALETYYTNHLSYAVPGMRLGVTSSAGNQIEVKTTATGYCIRGRSLAPTANPLDYTWYDSLAGGLQPGTGPISPSSGAGSACAGGGLFLPVQ